MSPSPTHDPTQDELSLYGEKGETFYRMAPETPLEVWGRVGTTLGTIGRASKWWIGDWLNFGAAVYGEEHAQYAGLSGYAPQTLLNLSWVCSRVLPETRFPDLSFGHHALVAKFDTPAEQQTWLAKAASGGWSEKRLREELALALGTGEGAEQGELIEPASAITIIRQAARAVLVEWYEETYANHNFQAITGGSATTLAREALFSELAGKIGLRAVAEDHDGVKIHARRSKKKKAEAEAA